jgi:hypothetical protein
MITFDIVNMDYPYTAIFGRGALNKFKIVIKQSYLCMKMPSPFGIIVVHGDKAACRRIEDKPIPGYSLVNEVSKKQPNEEVHIGSDLVDDEKYMLLVFLHENQDVFAWSAKDMQGVSRDLA